MAALASKAGEWLVAGGLLTVLGVLIRFRGWTFLLAGYDETSRVPDDVVQQTGGNTVLRVWLTVFAFGLFTHGVTTVNAMDFTPEFGAKAIGESGLRGVIGPELADLLK
ncbi:hypothetical protein [Halobellus ordinarius]|uniref:hypothetical protein n=1 Tax=Halobellus ordinarius TaxID=3075120 RepID=UPI002880AAA5|nr:hypothetical protein [Halobellus sp. ZY16]